MHQDYFIKDNFLRKKVDTKPGELMVYDALGRKVKSCSLPSNQKTFQLSLGELPAGIYMVAINSGGESFLTKMVKE